MSYLVESIMDDIRETVEANPETAGRMCEQDYEHLCQLLEHHRKSFSALELRGMGRGIITGFLASHEERGELKAKIEALSQVSPHKERAVLQDIVDDIEAESEFLASSDYSDWLDKQFGSASSSDAANDELEHWRGLALAAMRKAKKALEVENEP